MDPDLAVAAAELPVVMPAAAQAQAVPEAAVDLVVQVAAVPDPAVGVPVDLGRGAAATSKSKIFGKAVGIR